MMQPYDYQEEFIKAIYRCFKEGQTRVLGVAPTGSGKTVCASMVAAQTVRQGKRVWFVACLDALIDQTLDEFRNVICAGMGLPANMIGVIHRGYKAQYDRPIQIVAQMTADKRIREGTIKPEYYPDIWIDDEAHTTRFRVAAQRMIEIVRPRFEVGLTGSPCRTSPYESFDGLYDDVVFAPSVAELTERGKLADMKWHEVVDLTGIDPQGADIFNDEVAKTLYATKAAIARMFSIYMERGEGGKAIGFCVDVQHAHDCADYWREKGIPAAAIDHKTPRKKRRTIIDDFKKGNIWALFGRDVLSIGFDCKDTAVGLHMRPTQSRALWIQQIGRERRAAPGKPYGICLDFTGNCARHGYGLDEWHKYGTGTIRGILDPPKERGAEENPFLTLCQGATLGCTELLAPATKTCPKCGWEQVREPSDDGPAPRDFDGAMLETVQPSRLDPTNEHHAIRYYRYLRARAVLIHRSLPGKARYDLLACERFAHWADQIPRGQSNWVHGAIFQSPASVDLAKKYLGFLTGKYATRPEDQPGQHQGRIWYALEQEFDAMTLMQLRIILKTEKQEPVPVAEPKQPKAAKTVAVAW